MKRSLFLFWLLVLVAVIYLAILAAAATVEKLLDAADGY